MKSLNHSIPLAQKRVFKKAILNVRDGLQSVLRMCDSFCFGRLLISRFHGLQSDCIIYVRFCIC